MKAPTKTPRASPSKSRTARGSVRIIGGAWKRKVLHVVDAPGLRPTPDRVRETLFNWLAHANGGRLDCSVLDLFAGSGALGLEAASRGAAPVTLVDNNAAAVGQLQTARDDLGGAAQIDIQLGDALLVGARMQALGRRFDLIFLDPPFGQRWLDNALPLAVALCKPSGLIYVEAETPLHHPQLAPLGLELHRADRAGEVFYHLLRCNKKDD